MNTHSASVRLTQELKEELQRIYPKRAPVIHWDWSEIESRLAEGVTADELKAAARRYATYCQASGIAGTRYVAFPARFFGAGADAYWRQAFVVAGGRAESNTVSAEQRAEMSADKEAHRMGIQLRQAGEPLDRYQARVRAAVIQEAMQRMAKQGQGVSR